MMHDEWIGMDFLYRVKHSDPELPIGVCCKSCLCVRVLYARSVNGRIGGCGVLLLMVVGLLMDFTELVW